MVDVLYDAGCKFRCANLLTPVTVPASTVTAVVPSPTFTVSDSTTIANAIKAYASMTEDVLTTSTNGLA